MAQNHTHFIAALAAGTDPDSLDHTIGMIRGVLAIVPMEGDRAVVIVEDGVNDETFDCIEVLVASLPFVEAVGDRSRAFNYGGAVGVRIEVHKAVMAMEPKAPEDAVWKDLNGFVSAYRAWRKVADEIAVAMDRNGR